MRFFISLAETFSTLELPTRDTDDELEYFFARPVTEDAMMSVSEYVTRISSMPLPTPGSARPPYLGNIGLSDGDPRSPITQWLDSQFRFPGYLPGATSDVRIWVGAHGQRSSIHNDPYDNLNAQVYGDKRFVLFEPFALHDDALRGHRNAFADVNAIEDHRAAADRGARADTDTVDFQQPILERVRLKQRMHRRIVIDLNHVGVYHLRKPLTEHHALADAHPGGAQVPGKQ